MAETMRAIGYTTASAMDDEGAFVEREVEVPSLGPHDLLVEVRAVSVNPVDVKTRARTDPRGSGCSASTPRASSSGSAAR